MMTLEFDLWNNDINKIYQIDISIKQFQIFIGDLIFCESSILDSKQNKWNKDL